MIAVTNLRKVNGKQMWKTVGKYFCDHHLKMCRNANANASNEKPVAAEMGALFLAEMFLLFVIIYFCFTLMCVLCVSVCVYVEKWQNIRSNYI